LEKQAEELILGQTIVELEALRKEIELNLAADRSFALELPYWSSVLKKIEETTA
jgi:Conserved mid region of cactin